MRSTTTAASTRSPRNFGKMTPRLTAPTWWPARPMRWRPCATELGASTWTTSSTAPMSMPSSSELVATTARSLPALRSSSIWTRCSRLTDPWCARAMSSPASSFSLAQSRSARRRELVNTIVEWCALISSSSRSSMWGQMLRRSGSSAGSVPPKASPSRPSGPANGGGGGGGEDDGAASGDERGQVLDRDDHVEIERLLAGRGDHRHRLLAAEEAGHLVEGADRRRQADPLRRPRQQFVQPLEADGEVRAALGADHRVHLVDDHRLDLAERLPRLRGEQEEERLRRGDEDVGRLDRETATSVGWRVAGPHVDRKLRQRLSEPGSHRPQAGQWRPQVPLDVGGQRLQRGYIEDPQPSLRVDRRGVGEVVDGLEERRQRLPGAGGSHHQGVAATRDRLPRADLRRGRGGKGVLEPRSREHGEASERVLGRLEVR